MTGKKLRVTINTVGVGPEKFHAQSHDSQRERERFPRRTARHSHASSKYH